MIPVFGRSLTTYSFWASWRDCRRACKHRYIDGLVPVDYSESEALSFGQLIHRAMELWHGTYNLDSVRVLIDGNYPVYNVDPRDHALWHLANAMMLGYAARWANDQDEYEVVALEREFVGDIINPETDQPSRSFVLAGKSDGLVRERSTGELLIMEHKTAARIDGDYLDRLWTDFQTTLYAAYLEAEVGEPITGVLYNVLGKSRLQQREGETEEAFATRHSEACAKNKSGKSSATRAIAETDEEFSARLNEWYAQPDSFHRERLILSRDRFPALRSELWELSKSLLEARRRDSYYQNTSQCYGRFGGRPCAYLPICRSNGNPLLIDNLYRHEEPFQELELAKSWGKEPKTTELPF